MNANGIIDFLMRVDVTKEIERSNCLPIKAPDPNAVDSVLFDEIRSSIDASCRANCDHADDLSLVIQIELSSKTNEAIIGAAHSIPNDTLGMVGREIHDPVTLTMGMVVPRMTVI